MEYLNNNYGFNIESFASIVGVSMNGLELLPYNNKYNLCEVDFNKFERFFTDKNSNRILESEGFSNLTYKELLIELFYLKSVAIASVEYIINH